MNTKSRRQAILMALSDRAKSERIAILDKFELPELKTKHLAKLRQQLAPNRSTLIILPTSQPEMVRVGRNIPHTHFIRADSLNVYDLLKWQHLIILQPALPIISKTFVK